MTTLTGCAVVLRPLRPDDAAPLRAILASPKVARWWDPDQHPDWPFEPGNDTQRFAVLEQESHNVIGLVQFAEETDPQYRHASVDIILDPRVHSRGLGTDAVRTVVRHLLDDLGHHRVTIDPAVANAAAIRCYEKVGFRRVGVLRRYERSPGSGIWRDGLLMDLLAGDLT